MRIEREREEDREEAALRGGQASGVGHYKRSVVIFSKYQVEYPLYQGGGGGGVLGPSA